MLTQTDQNACSRNLNNEIQKKQVIWQPEKILDVYSVFLWTSYGVFILKKFPRWLSGKEITCQCRRHTGGMSWIPGMGRSPGGGSGNLLQSSLLENPVDTQDGQATVHGVAKSQTWLSNWACTHTHTHKHTHIHTHTYFILKLGTQSKINRSLFLRIPDLC